jgi:hypothetical protein
VLARLKLNSVCVNVNFNITRDLALFTPAKVLIHPRLETNYASVGRTDGWHTSTPRYNALSFTT